MVRTWFNLHGEDYVGFIQDYGFGDGGVSLGLIWSLTVSPE